MNLDRKHSSSTAILLFAQSNKIKSILKPITYQKKQNDLSWQKISNEVLQTIPKTALVHFISDEKTQVGVSFEDKLSQAIQAVLKKVLQ